MAIIKATNGAKAPRIGGAARPNKGTNSAERRAKTKGGDQYRQIDSHPPASAKQSNLPLLTRPTPLSKERVHGIKEKYSAIFSEAEAAVLQARAIKDPTIDLNQRASGRIRSEALMVLNHFYPNVLTTFTQKMAVALILHGAAAARASGTEWDAAGKALARVHPALHDPWKRNVAFALKAFGEEGMNAHYLHRAIRSGDEALKRFLMQAWGNIPVLDFASLASSIDAETEAHARLNAYAEYFEDFHGVLEDKRRTLIARNPEAEKYEKLGEFAVGRMQRSLPARWPLVPANADQAAGRTVDAWAKQEEEKLFNRALQLKSREGMARKSTVANEALRKVLKARELPWGLKPIPVELDFKFPDKFRLSQVEAILYAIYKTDSFAWQENPRSLVGYPDIRHWRYELRDTRGETLQIAISQLMEPILRSPSFQGKRNEEKVAWHLIRAIQGRLEQNRANESAAQAEEAPTTPPVA